MYKPNTMNRRPYSRRVTAAVVAGLAGLTLMCAVPAVAHAEEVDVGAQATATQTAQASDEAQSAASQATETQSSTSTQATETPSTPTPATETKAAEKVETKAAAKAEAKAAAKAEAKADTKTTDTKTTDIKTTETKDNDATNTTDTKTSAADEKTDASKADAKSDTDTKSDASAKDETKSDTTDKADAKSDTDTKSDASAKDETKSDTTTKDAAKADDAKTDTTKDAAKADATDKSTDTTNAGSSNSLDALLKKYLEASRGKVVKVSDIPTITESELRAMNAAANAEAAAAKAAEKAAAKAAAKDAAKSDTSKAGVTTVTKWEDYNGGKTSDTTIGVAKKLVEVIGGAIAKKPGDVAKAILGLIKANVNNTEYTTNQIMHQLYDMENQISGVSTQVYNLQSSLDTFKSELFSRNSFAAIKGFRDLLASDTTGVKAALSQMVETLSQYKEVDGDKTTDTTCSLTTDVDRLPEKARAAVKEIISNVEQESSTYTSKSLENVEYTLYNSVCSNEAGNLVKDYFNLLNNTYNWDVQTFDAKQKFIAHLAQMYTNAYMFASAKLSMERADAKAAGKSTKFIDGKIQNLSYRAAAFKEALFGKDGKGGFYALTLQNGNKVYNYVNKQSYDTGTYANVAAYGSVNDTNEVSTRNTFEQAYVHGDTKTLDHVAANWNVKSGFTTNQIVEMVNRLNALKSAGLAAKKSDGTVVDGVLEEMATLGFKTVKTDGNDKDTTWKGHLAGYDGYKDKIPLIGLVYNKVSTRAVELGDSSQSTIVPEEDEFHLGTRLTNSGDWVITNVTRARCSAGGQTVCTGFGSNVTHHAYCAYGDVVNVKTGEVKKDQLLYAIRVTSYSVGSFNCDLEYYAFGVLAPGTTSASLGDLCSR